VQPRYLTNPSMGSPDAPPSGVQRSWTGMLSDHAIDSSRALRVVCIGGGMLMSHLRRRLLLHCLSLRKAHHQQEFPGSLQLAAFRNRLPTWTLSSTKRTPIWAALGTRIDILVCVAIYQALATSSHLRTTHNGASFLPRDQKYRLIYLPPPRNTAYTSIANSSTPLSEHDGWRWKASGRSRCTTC